MELNIIYNVLSNAYLKSDNYSIFVDIQNKTNDLSLNEFIIKLSLIISMNDFSVFHIFWVILVRRFKQKWVSNPIFH